jgi:predicted O-methyltransferase YrrM
LDAKIEAVLAEYDARAERESVFVQSSSRQEVEARKDELLLHIGRDSGQLLNILIKAHGAKTLVEIGASYGYSTIWFAEAARATGGRVISFELQAAKVDYTRQRLKQAELSDFVEFRTGDAVDLLRQLEDSVDFALIDLWKDLYIPCFELLLPHLGRGAFVVADNMLLPPAFRASAQRYRRHLRASDRFDSVLLPVGGGLEVSRLRDDL